METERPARSEYLKAWDRMTRFLALRDHSRSELTLKLRQREFSDEVIVRVLADAEARGLVASDSILADRQREIYDRRLKSRRFIEEQLRRRDLPVPPPRDSGEGEVAKMTELITRKFGDPQSISNEDRGRAVRFLKYRGFEDRLIRRVLNHAEC